MKSNKKGQAAMEFLMTYGWAILAAVVVIGVLAYFGVFSPGRFLPSACITNAPFGCDEFGITALTGIELKLRNGGGESMTVSSVNVTGCGENTVSFVVADGGTGVVTVACAGAEGILIAGEKFKGDITVKYKKTAGGTITQVSSGTITGTVN